MAGMIKSNFAEHCESMIIWYKMKRDGPVHTVCPCGGFTNK
jgi:hypothetical protein